MAFAAPVSFWRVVAVGVGVMAGFVGCGSDFRTAGVDKQQKGDNLAPFVDNGPPANPPPANPPPANPPPEMSTGGGGCGAIDQLGTCTGEVLKYCDSGQLMTLDCAANDATCEVDPTTDEAVCVATSACGTLTYDGNCTGDVVTWCETDGTVQTFDCHDLDLTCVVTGGVADCG